MARIHLFKVYSYNIRSYGSYRSDLYNMHSRSIQYTNRDTCAYKIGTIQSPYIISSSKYMNQYLVHASKTISLKHLSSISPMTQTQKRQEIARFPFRQRDAATVSLLLISPRIFRRPGRDDTWGYLGHKQYHLSFLTLKSIRTITSEEPKICFKSFHVSQEM